MIKYTTIISLLFFLTCFAQQGNEQNSKYLLAQSYENAGDFQSAIKIYEELIQADPDNPQYFVLLNRAYMQVKNYAASINLLEDHLVKYPDDTETYGMLGSTYYLMGNENKAFEVWEKPLQKAGATAITYRVIGNFAVERRAFEKAIEFFKEGKEKTDNKIIFSMDLARLYGITMQYVKAAGEYCDILKSDQSQYQLVRSGVFTLISKPEVISKILPVFEEVDNGSNNAITGLLAELYTQNKEYDKAFQLYTELDKKESSKGNRLLNFAQLLFQEKEYTTAANTFEKIYSLYPDNNITSLAKLGYAKSLEAKLFEEYTNVLPIWKPEFKAQKFESSEITEVLNAFSEIVKLYKNSEAAFEAELRIGMINLYMLGNKEEAVKKFRTVVSEAPLSKSSGEAYLELGDLELSDGNLNEAEKNYLQVSKINSDEKTVSAAQYKLARIKYYEGKNADAYNLVSSLTNNLKDDYANDAIAFSIILNNAKFDSSNGVLFAKAELLAEQKKYKEAAEIFGQISDDKNAMLFQPVALYRLAEIEIAEDNFSRSVEILQRIVDEKDKNMYADKALFLMGKVYQYGLKDKSKAVEIYEKLLSLFPNSILIDDAREKILSLRNKLS